MSNIKVITIFFYYIRFMRKLFILMFLSTGLSAQSISKKVIAPLGGTISNGNNQLSYTAGEIVIGGMTSEDGSIQLGNGYYPSLDLSTLSTETPELQLQVKVYPNPVAEVIFISHPTEYYFEVRITDVSGKQILKSPHQKQQPLSVQSLTSGTYFVTVTTRDSKQTNSYKIIKK
jgi:hypothetical protein